MLTTIIAAIITGLIIGVIARMVLPGGQNISILETILVGILGSVIGTWLTSFFGYNGNNGGIAWIPLIVGVLVAAGLIVLYERIRSRSATPRV